MDLRQMRAFQAIADNLHFRRAAESLGISQPALSQQLARLEAELGTELVVRTSREVSLTQVGELFLEACARTLAEANRALELVRDAPSGITGRLIIGALGAGANGPLPGMIRAFRAGFPELLVELHHFPESAAQERGLLAGTIDVAVVRSIANEQSIESRKIFDEPFVVYLPIDHPLADRAVLDLADLSGEDFVIWPRAIGPAYYDLVIDGCRRAGFTPRIQGYGTSLEAQLALVAAGVGVSLQAASNSSISRARIACVPVTPADMMSPLWLAWRRWHRSRLVDRFLEST